MVHFVSNMETIRSPISGWPTWLPTAARHYLDHTEAGRPIRVLAREARVHASTVLRQVRKLEARREDPLIDAALRDLAGAVTRTRGCRRGNAAMSTDDQPLTDARILSEGAAVLRQLMQPGAILAVADGMETAVVVRETAARGAERFATVTRDLAQALALKDWIGCADPGGRILRYRITAQGRSALQGLMAGQENSAHGFAEGQARFEGATPASQGRRSAGVDSPLAALARRKDREGQPFLTRELLDAGERLREDFELAQIGARVTQDWSQFLTARVETSGRGMPIGTSAREAQERVAAALADLGPGLGDVALRCCCHQEGMESVEKRMGWAARSGKIVLRIALQRLQLFYEQQGEFGPMIG